MSRTTLDIDPSILEEIRRLQQKEKTSMGKIVSRLLAEALSRRAASPNAATLEWVSKDMEPLIDISDKEALYAELDRDEP